MPIRRPRPVSPLLSGLRSRKQADSAAQESVLGRFFSQHAIRDRDDGGEPGMPTAAYLSPDHAYLAVVRDYTALEVYRLAGERLGEKVCARSVSRLPRVEWSSSSTMLAFVNGRYEAEVVSVPAGRSTVLFLANAVSFYPDSSWLAVLGNTSLNISHVTSLKDPARTIIYKSGVSYGNPFGVSPDGLLIACGTARSTVQILRADDLQVTHELHGHGEMITDLQWLDPDTLATASADGTVRIWGAYGGRELRVLEAETGFLGLSYSPALDCLVGWTPDEYLAWSVSVGDILSQQELPVPAGLGYRYASASPRGDLFVKLDGPDVADIAFSHGWDSDGHHRPPPASVSTYANAKVLLLGDSGVGKSGLALVLAGESFRPTESTHARRIWKMPVPELNQGGEAQREVLLWDLAGQPGYRIVHQLHLSGGAVALILFDSRSETTPLAGIGYWARALQQAQAASAAGRDPVPAFLVGARTDRGVVGVSNERLAEVVAEFGFRDYLPTSAKENWGVAEIRATVLAAIDWSRLPVVTSSALFAAAKSFVLDQKAAGTLLTPLTSLLSSFLGAPVTGPAAEAAPHARVGRDLLDSGPEGDQTRLRNVFEGCVARLESAGLVRRLAFGDLVLLQPELIDVYAGAIVNAARDEPDGLGSMLESRVLAVDFRLPELERIADRQQEKLLIIATLEELTRHEIVLREETEDGVQLVFPAAFRRDLPEADEPADNEVEFAFEGPVDNIYATLVVRLARSDRFARHAAFQSAAQFEADSGGICTVHLTRSDEGRGVLQVGYAEAVADVVRAQFERFVLAHLERRATPGTIRRARLYRCPECGNLFTHAQIEAALSRGRTGVLCPADETRVPLEDSLARESPEEDAVTEQMDASADAARSVAAASSIILGKRETTDFDVFMCHHSDDKPAVREMAKRLQDHGLLPWLDEAQLIPGRPWQDELERQIGSIRAAAVFVGPGGVGPWQNQEMRAFLNEFAVRECPVIPVLLPGGAAPQLPLFLRSMTWVDLQAADGFERLVWGITGHRPVASG